MYTRGADIWVLDVASGKDQLIDVQLPTDRIRERNRVEDASKTFEGYALNQDGKKLALSARRSLGSLGKTG